jgi:hypothetical protein
LRIMTSRVPWSSSVFMSVRPLRLSKGEDRTRPLDSQGGSSGPVPRTPLTAEAKTRRAPKRRRGRQLPSPPTNGENIAMSPIAANRGRAKARGSQRPFPTKSDFVRLSGDDAPDIDSASPFDERLAEILRRCGRLHCPHVHYAHHATCGDGSSSCSAECLRSPVDLSQCICQLRRDPTDRGLHTLAISYSKSHFDRRQRALLRHIAHR